MSELLGHRGAVRGARFHPRDSRVLVTAGNDGTARTWQLPVTTVLSASGESSRIDDADLSPNGRWVVTAKDNGWLRVRRSDTGALEAQYKQGGAVDACPAEECRNSVAFTADGTEVIATPTLGTKPLVWRWRARGAPRRLEESRALITTVAVSPAAHTMAAGTRLNEVDVWNLATGKIVARLSTGRPEYVVSNVAFVPRSNLIAAGGSDGTVSLWDPSHPDQPRRIFRKPVESAIRALDVTPDGNYLVAAAQDYRVQVWRVSDGKEQMALQLDARIGDVAFSPDGAQLAVGTADASVHVWQWRDKREIAVLRRHGDAISSLDFAGDGTRLFSASDDSTVAVYRCTTCKPFDQVLRDAKHLDRINDSHDESTALPVRSE
ncbi:MAG: WD40 repeat domain-containing protein [Mycobacterium leprae]